jgi:hypothetical protein
VERGTIRWDGILKSKRDAGRDEQSSRFYSVTLEVVSVEYFDHFHDDAGMIKSVDVCWDYF